MSFVPDSLRSYRVSSRAMFFTMVFSLPRCIYSILFIQYFKRVTHFAVMAILPCGPLCKYVYIYTNTKII